MPKTFEQLRKIIDANNKITAEIKPEELDVVPDGQPGFCTLAFYYAKEGKIELALQVFNHRNKNNEKKLNATSIGFYAGLAASNSKELINLALDAEKKMRGIKNSNNQGQRRIDEKLPDYKGDIATNTSYQAFRNMRIKDQVAYIFAKGAIALGFAIAGKHNEAQRRNFKKSKEFLLLYFLYLLPQPKENKYSELKQAIDRYDIQVNVDLANLFLVQYNINNHKKLDETCLDWLSLYKRNEGSAGTVSPEFALKNFKENCLDANNFRLPALQALYKLASQQLLIKQQSESLLEINTSNINNLDSNFNNYVKEHPEVNAHKNPRLDRFFGIKNTASWRAAWGEVKQEALAKIFDKVDSLKDKEEQLKLLRLAHELPMFNEHRNNTIFKGAFGKTASVKKIEAKMKELEKGKKSKDKTKGVTATYTASS